LLSIRGMRLVIRVFLLIAISTVLGGPTAGHCCSCSPIQAEGFTLELATGSPEIPPFDGDCVLAPAGTTDSPRVTLTCGEERFDFYGKEL
jgi:hypothetical protein